MLMERRMNVAFLSKVYQSIVTSVCMLYYSWEGWVNDFASLPVHIYFKASSETHTREEKAGRLTG